MNSNPASPHRPAASPAPGALVPEVRYSLPELLAEVQFDRSSGFFAQEKLSQQEIDMLFATPSKRRVKKRRH